ncbi:MAG: hypothetical protein JOY77_01475 [Alphaproteobacteria bacterium]|nr:hypothetical protein [Alphaproteobacteria bacterium]
MLPPKVRAQRYREMAEAAFMLAADAPSAEIKGSYLNLASSWHALAGSLENELGEEIAATVRDNVGADA